MRARPLPLSVASVLLALLSLANLLSPAMPSEGVPAFVIYLGVVLGVLGLIGAAGLWMLKRWALWLTIVVCVCVCSTSSRRLRGWPSRRPPRSERLQR